MVTRRFEPERAVEIISPRYGSGYRIGSSLVLTAAHLVEGVGTECRVRSKRVFDDANARVIWKARSADISLIKLSEQNGLWEAVVFGLLPKAGAGETLSFQMYGYPYWARTKREGVRTAAGGRQIEGVIYLADSSPDDLLVLEPNRLPAEGMSDSGSEWKGCSGAAIVCDGLIVAVQSHHQNPNRSASLEAAPLKAIYDDEQWCVLLEQHGIDPKPVIVQLRAEEKSLQLNIPHFNSNNPAVFVVGTGSDAADVIAKNFSSLIQLLVDSPSLTISEKIHKLGQNFLEAKNEDSLLHLLSEEEIQSIRDLTEGRLKALQYLKDEQQRESLAKNAAYDCYQLIVKHRPNTIDQSLEALIENLKFVLKWLNYSLRDYADRALSEEEKYDLITIPEDLRYVAFQAIKKKIVQRTQSDSAGREVAAYLDILFDKLQE